MRYLLMAIALSANAAVFAAPIPADALAAPDLAQMQPVSRTLPAVMHRFRMDADSVEHIYDVAWGPGRRAALTTLYRSWQQRLAQIDAGKLGLEDRIDPLLLPRDLDQRLPALQFEPQRFDEVNPFRPCARDLPV